MGKKLFATEESRGRFLWILVGGLFIGITALAAWHAFNPGWYSPLDLEAAVEDVSGPALAGRIYIFAILVIVVFVLVVIVALLWAYLLAWLFAYDVDGGLRERWPAYDVFLDSLGGWALRAWYYLTWPIHTPFRLLANWKRYGTWRKPRNHHYGGEIEQA